MSKISPLLSSQSIEFKARYGTKNEIFYCFVDIGTLCTIFNDFLIQKIFWNFFSEKSNMAAEKSKMAALTLKSLARIFSVNISDRHVIFDMFHRCSFLSVLTEANFIKFIIFQLIRENNVLAFFTKNQPIFGTFALENFRQK